MSFELKIWLSLKTPNFKECDPYYNIAMKPTEEKYFLSVCILLLMITFKLARQANYEREGEKGTNSVELKPTLLGNCHWHKHYKFVW